MDKGEKRLLQIGGLGAILAPIVFLASVSVAQPTSPQSGQMAQFLSQLVQNRTPVVIFSAGWVIFSLLTVPFFLALYRSMRQTGLGYALIGSVFGVISASSILVLFVLQSQASLTLADLYNTATAADKTTVVIVAEDINAALSPLFVVEFIVRVIAIFAIAAAMMGSTAFGKRYGWISVILGLTFIALVPFFAFGSIVFIVDALVYFAWLIIVGQKVYRLSRVA